MKYFAGVLLVLVTIGGGCLSQPRGMFDASTLEVGDKVSGLTVVSVTPLSESFPLSNENVDAIFGDRVMVMGEVTFDFNDFFGKEMACMRVTGAETEKLPHSFTRHSEELPLCFRNLDDFKTLFGSVPLGYREERTVIIENYEYRYGPVEGVSAADIVYVYEE